MASNEEGCNAAAKESEKKVSRAAAPRGAVVRPLERPTSFEPRACLGRVIRTCDDLNGWVPEKEVDEMWKGLT